MVYMTIKVKKQFKRKGSAISDGYLGSFYGYKLNFRKESNVQTKPITILKVVKPSYVKKKVAGIEEKEEIMFS